MEEMDIFVRPLPRPAQYGEMERERSVWEHGA